MMYRCELCLVFGEGSDHEVLIGERLANSPVLSLELALRDLIRAASVIDIDLPKHAVELQLLGWVDPVLDAGEIKMEKAKQRIDDKAGNPMGEAFTAKVVHARQGRLSEEPAVERDF